MLIRLLRNSYVYFVAETKGQDQPEDANLAKARPQLKQGTVFPQGHHLTGSSNISPNQHTNANLVLFNNNALGCGDRQTDKASMLDEVIDHLKQLQAQVQMMSRMSSMNMMMPMAMPQLQMMANMAQMAQMAQMGLGMMNMAGPLAQPAYPSLAPSMMHSPTPFVPMQPWNAAADRQKQPAAAAVPDAYSAFLACQAAAQQNAQVCTQRPC